MPDPFAFDEVFDLAPLTRRAAWDLVTRVGCWTTWWPWLDLAGIDRVAVGATAEVGISSPLGWTLDVRVTPTEVTAPRRIAAEVTGDVHGPAALDLLEGPGGCAARLTGALSLGDGLVAHLAELGRPVIEAAHHKVLADGHAQFLDAVGAEGALAPGRCTA